MVKGAHAQGEAVDTSRPQSEVEAATAIPRMSRVWVQALAIPNCMEAQRWALCRGTLQGQWSEETDSRDRLCDSLKMPD